MPNECFPRETPRYPAAVSRGVPCGSPAQEKPIHKSVQQSSAYLHHASIHAGNKNHGEGEKHYWHTTIVIKHENKMHSTRCEIECFVATHLCKLCVILRSYYEAFLRCWQHGFLSQRSQNTCVHARCPAYNNLSSDVWMNMTRDERPEPSK